MSKPDGYLIDELGDMNAEKGTKPWLLYIANELRKAIYDESRKAEALENYLSLFKQYNGWQEFGYLTWEEYCEDRLGKQPIEIENVLNSRKIAQVRSVNPQQRPMGRPPKSHYNYNDFQQGTSAEYLTARIARDRPDILAKLQRGEYRSTREAAIDAGIIDPEKSKRYSLPTDPIKAANYLKQRVDDEWIFAFMEALTS